MSDRPIPREVHDALPLLSLQRWLPSARAERERAWLDIEAGLQADHEARTNERMRQLAAAARRTDARLAYDSAQSGRSVYGWAPGRTSANTEIRSSLQFLRNKARDLSRNEPYVSRAVELWADNVVGTGITPRCTAPGARGERAQKLWDVWQRQCSVGDDQDFYGLQRLAWRAAWQDGEVLLRQRARRPTDGLAVPLQIEVLEADYLDEMRDGIASDTGGIVRMGVEYNALTQRTGYWIMQGHPGDYIWAPGQPPTSVLVSASLISHCALTDRPGQVRGVTQLAPVLNALKELDDYNRSERMRQRSQAATVGVVIPADDASYDPATTDAIGDTADSGGMITDAQGRPLDDIQPGEWHVARMGKDVKFLSPVPNTGYDAYVKLELHRIASALEIPYELLASDLSQVNYSSIRAGLLAFKQRVQIFQRRYLIPFICQWTWDRFIAFAVASGALPPGEYPVQWILPHTEELDRDTAIRADMAGIRAGLTSRKAVAEKYGLDIEQVDREIAADQARADRLGIASDADARHSSQGPGQWPFPPPAASSGGA